MSLPQLASSFWRGDGHLKSASCSKPINASVFIYHWSCQQSECLAIVGGGAAGFFAAIRAKEVCSSLDVHVFEKNDFLSKVKISGGGRCNVTTGLYHDPVLLSGQYPRGHRELRGSFFRTHGPKDTAAWFTERGVTLKTEDDGRMFPESNNSMTIVHCLMNEAKKHGVILQNKTPVMSVSVNSDSTFDIAIGREKHPSRHISAKYLLLATGSSPKGYIFAKQLKHTIVDPLPSLFTFKVAETQLQNLAGVSFQMVRAELHVEGQKRKNPNLTQNGPMLITHWGLSGPVVLRLSAWGARDLFPSQYQGTLFIDFEPKLSSDVISQILNSKRKENPKRKLGSYSPLELSLTRRFWEYLLKRLEIDPDDSWASLSNSSLQRIVSLLKRCQFSISGKGEFKEEFVTAGGVPVSEVDLKTMESRLCTNLYFAGEVLNVDGVTGGFNFQNAWTGGYISGTCIGLRAKGG